MNGLKHANASNMWLNVRLDGDVVELILRDDGAGFDSELPGPEGHYGLTMMRERALVGGGTYELKSAVGQGTTITVRFPTSWLQEDSTEVPGLPAAPLPSGVSPDTRPAPEGSPVESVHA